MVHFLFVVLLFSFGGLLGNSQANSQTDVPNIASKQPLSKPSFPKSLFRGQSPVKVTAIINPLTIALGDGSIIRLSGVDIPGVFSKSGPSEIAITAQARLNELLNNKSISLYQSKGKRNQNTNAFGHYLGQALIGQDEWLQYILVSEGLARVQPAHSMSDIMPLLLTAEQYAREAKLGLWDDPQYAIVTAEEAKPNAYDMQIVTGTVQSVSTVRNTAYINFGENWRDDFTVQIEGTVRRALSNKQINPVDWQGKTLRIRGYVESYNGPMIKLRYVEQIEVLN